MHAERDGFTTAPADCSGEMSVTSRLWTRARLPLVAPLVAAALALGAAPGAVAGPGPCPNADTPIAHASRAAMQAAVVCLVNEQRTARQLPRLIADPRLNRSAQGWTDAMVGRRLFSHGTAFMDRFSAVGFDWSNVGENIATGFQTPRAVVMAWMASPGHCANMLDPLYREVGTGVENRSIRGASTIDGTWTQDLGLLMGQRPLSGDFGPARACER